MGLIKAGIGALGGVLADQWKEFFYCDGSDRKISLSPEQRQQLKQLLQRELTGK